MNAPSVGLMTVPIEIRSVSKLWTIIMEHPIVVGSLLVISQINSVDAILAQDLKPENVTNFFHGIEFYFDQQSKSEFLDLSI